MSRSEAGRRLELRGFHGGHVEADLRGLDGITELVTEGEDVREVAAETLGNLGEHAASAG